MDNNEVKLSIWTCELLQKSELLWRRGRCLSSNYVTPQHVDQSGRTGKSTAA
jgi:hypothetical protein